MSDLYPRIYACINTIPPGKVASYGQIAQQVSCGPRQVGYALNVLPSDTRICWHRVVNREGKISLRSVTAVNLQRQRLEEEGVAFDLNGRIDLSVFQYHF